MMLPVFWEKRLEKITEDKVDTIDTTESNYVTTTSPYIEIIKGYVKAANEETEETDTDQFDFSQYKKYGIIAGVIFLVVYILRG